MDHCTEEKLRGEVECPVCGVSFNPKAREARHHWSGIEFTLYSCLMCGAGFWCPRIIPEKDYYEQKAESISKPTLVRHTIGNRVLAANHLMFLTRHPLGSGSLLDIGCGDGHFLEEAGKRGFQVAGVDFDSKALAVARGRGLDNLYHETLNEFASRVISEGARFDTVTLFEVLEHQPEPIAFMDTVKQLVRPGGIVSGSVPNRDRLGFEMAQVLDQPPYHFTRWSAKVLRHFLERIGLKDIFIGDVGHGDYCMSLFNPLNKKVKKMFFDNIDATALQIYTLEEAATKAWVSEGKFALLRILKRAKLATFIPIIGIETFISRTLHKGQSLYFEGRLRI
jgi:2-polyprenyl-3-methyl-5-hydroxy-6-metoxy-1,4-benzoquinol methylase/uncharacterized CHY-type Zn-finger protein